MVYKKYDLILTIEANSLFIAESVQKDLSKALVKIYRDIIFKTEIKEHPDFKNAIKLNKEQVLKSN